MMLSLRSQKSFSRQTSWAGKWLVTKPAKFVDASPSSLSDRSRGMWRMTCRQPSAPMTRPG